MKNKNCNLIPQDDTKVKYLLLSEYSKKRLRALKIEYVSELLLYLNRDVKTETKKIDTVLAQDSISTLQISNINPTFFNHPSSYIGHIFRCKLDEVNKKLYLYITDNYIVCDIDTNRDYGTNGNMYTVRCIPGKLIKNRIDRQFKTVYVLIQDINLNCLDLDKLNRIMYNNLILSRMED